MERVEWKVEERARFASAGNTRNPRNVRETKFGGHCEAATRLGGQLFSQGRGQPTEASREATRQFRMIYIYERYWRLIAAARCIALTESYWRRPVF